MCTLATDSQTESKILSQIPSELQRKVADGDQEPFNGIPTRGAPFEGASLMCVVSNGPEACRVTHRTEASHSVAANASNSDYLSNGE